MPPLYRAVLTVTAAVGSEKMPSDEGVGGHTLPKTACIHINVLSID
jgi:hypothetical protein